jgi:hypothetical protein
MTKVEARPTLRQGRAAPNPVSVRRMNRAIALLTCLSALVLATPAHAASKSCTRGGAKLLAASGSVRVVSVKERLQRSDTRRDRVLGCWTSTGRRFTMFVSRDAGLDEIQHDAFTIVDGRYAGVLTRIEGGVSEDQRAAVYDVKTRKRLHASTACESFDTGDFGGVTDVAFLPRGGLAYACGRLRIADGHGERELEPAGTDVRSLAVATNSHDFRARLYWTVVSGGTETLKSLDL